MAFNYGYLQNEAEKTQALDDIIFCFHKRFIHKQSILNSILTDEYIKDTIGILKEIPNFLLEIPNKSIHNNYTYLHLTIALLNLAPWPFSIDVTKIIDNYNKVDHGSCFEFEIEANGISFSKLLRKRADQVDFNFLIPIIDAVQQSSFKGQFYLIEDHYRDDAQSFIFLNDSEHELIKQKKLIYLYPLDNKIITNISS